MATRICEDGSTAVVEPVNGRKFDLHEVQGHVGGYVTPIRLGKGLTMLVDEDGIPKGRPVNPHASAVARFPVVGDVLIVKRGEF